MAATVHIVDELLSAPGAGRALLSLYQANYAPAARARGLRLDRIVVSPPVWLREQSNRLLILWTVEGAEGWWGQAVQARYDPAVAAFWDEAQGLIASRRRFYGAAEADLEALVDV